ncbi:GNAT family N-acetyltransferase [Sporosarcina sp. P29]|uniref:GNAT family N-acetyltransferase n=1 Tax=Sporosarcina sp. P29 TaxID=2048252 RepID=UPI000C16A2D1|nr:GNAT family N-acetyltransferase [Sporosarcina sp. P29]PIC99575.1 GNAT family acetyltransferase [Sporosarcina sp. P29]
MNKVEENYLNDGYKKYVGSDLDIFYSIKKCEHAGVCARGNAEVFNPKRRPWILPDNGEANQVMKVIDACPSGALGYIKKEDSEKVTFLKGENRFYLENDEGQLIAEITFTTPNPAIFIIDHTFVDPSLRGKGIAQSLVKEVVTKARAEDRKILPLCPFAKLEFERKEEYADVWKR